MLKALDDPAFVEALMARGAEYAIAYGRALADAGADLLSGGDSPAGLLGLDLYTRLALPFERTVIAALQATGKPVSLHICGNATSLLRPMAGSGADVLELDHFVDLTAACRLAGPTIAIWGNLDPVGVLARGTPAQVEGAARKALAAVKSVGHRAVCPQFRLHPGSGDAAGEPRRAQPGGANFPSLGVKHLPRPPA